MSARTGIFGRFVKFFHELRNSACKEVQVFSRHLARDMKSVTGKNLWLVQEVSGLNPWSSTIGKIKSVLHHSEQVAVHPQLPYLVGLLRQRRQMHILALKNEEETLTELINSLVKN